MRFQKLWNILFHIKIGFHVVLRFFWYQTYWKIRRVDVVMLSYVKVFWLELSHKYSKDDKNIALRKVVATWLCVLRISLLSLGNHFREIVLSRPGLYALIFAWCAHWFPSLEWMCLFCLLFRNLLTRYLRGLCSLYCYGLIRFLSLRFTVWTVCSFFSLR